MLDDDAMFTVVSNDVVRANCVPASTLRQEHAVDISERLLTGHISSNQVSNDRVVRRPFAPHADTAVVSAAEISMTNRSPTYDPISSDCVARGSFDEHNTWSRDIDNLKTVDRITVGADLHSPGIVRWKCLAVKDKSCVACVNCDFSAPR